MTINTKHVFDEASDVVKTEENYWVLSRGKITIYKLDCETIEKVFYSRISPYMMKIDYTGRYIFMIRNSYAIECYDIKTKSLVSTLDFALMLDKNPEAVYPCFDNLDEVYVICGKTKEEKITMKSVVDPEFNYTILRYRLPDFTLVDTLTFEENFKQMIPIDFKKEYILITDKGKLYRFDGKVVEDLDIKPMAEPNYHVVVDNKRKQILIEENNALRIYNDSYQDVNLISLAREAKKDDLDDFFLECFNQRLNRGHNLLDALDRAGYVDLEVVLDDYLLVHSPDFFRNASFLGLCNIETGEEYACLKLAVIPSNIHVFGNEIIYHGEGRGYVVTIDE